VTRSDVESSGRRFVVVLCHPLPNSFVRAAGDRAMRALASGGHGVEVLDLDAEGFNPLLSPAEWALRDAGVPDTLTAHVDALRRATDLVLVYPTWYGSMPALMKGWFDRVWGRGVAWEISHNSGRPRGLLRNITSVWVVTSHGSNRWVNFGQGEGGLRFVRRTLRLTCAPWIRTHWVAFYGNDSAGESERVAFLARVERVFAKA
jgi:NAD(P)H dehydrogenase (quinone)